MKIKHSPTFTFVMLATFFILTFFCGAAAAVPADELFCEPFPSLYDCLDDVRTEIHGGGEKRFCYRNHCLLECEIDPSQCSDNVMCDTFTPERVTKACDLAKIVPCKESDFFKSEVHDGYLCLGDDSWCIRYEHLCRQDAPKVGTHFF